MSYDAYVNETHAATVANSDQWELFVDWADEIDDADGSNGTYQKIWTLTEYLYVSHPSELRKELLAAKKAGLVPSELSRVVKALIEASKKLGGEKDEDSILWVTDGCNGLINELIPADDPDHMQPGDDDDAAE